MIYPRGFGCVKTTRFCRNIIEQVYRRYLRHLTWFQMAGWKKHECFRDGTILRNPLEVLMVGIHQINTLGSPIHYTQSAPFLSFWEFTFLWVKWINRPNNSLQTLAYNADCIVWECEYLYQSLLVTLNTFSLSINQNYWKPQFSHLWSNWATFLSKRRTESATTTYFRTFRQCFDQEFSYRGAES